MVNQNSSVLKPDAPSFDIQPVRVPKPVILSNENINPLPRKMYFNKYINNMIVTFINTHFLTFINNRK